MSRDLHRPRTASRVPGPRGEAEGESAAGRLGSEGYSTFRPNPAGEPDAASPKRAEPTVRKRARDRTSELGEKFEMPAGGPTWWERILLRPGQHGPARAVLPAVRRVLERGRRFHPSRFRACEKQFYGTALGPILGRIQVAIRRGSTLEEAMAREPQAFGPMFLNMIKVAEARGGVPETLKMLAQHYEARQRLIRQAARR